MPWKDKNAWRLHRDPAKHREVQRRYRLKHGPELDTRWHRVLRKKALEALGGCCCECGFDDWRALEIDHIGNNGGEDRRKRNRNRMLQDIIQGNAQGQFQLLCANCHQIKSYEEVWKHSTGRRQVVI